MANISTYQNVVRIKDRFDFSGHREFNEQVGIAMKHGDRELIIDFAQAAYLDSAALGMLLIAKEKAGQLNKTVVLQAPKNDVAKVLAIANFNKLFEIRS